MCADIFVLNLYDPCDRNIKIYIRSIRWHIYFQQRKYHSNSTKILVSKNFRSYHFQGIKIKTFVNKVNEPWFVIAEERKHLLTHVFIECGWTRLSTYKTFWILGNGPALSPPASVFAPTQTKQIHQLRKLQFRLKSSISGRQRCQVLFKNDKSPTRYGIC